MSSVRYHAVTTRLTNETYAFATSAELAFDLEERAEKLISSLFWKDVVGLDRRLVSAIEQTGGFIDVYLVSRPTVSRSTVEYVDAVECSSK